MTDRPLGKSVHLWNQRPMQNCRHQSVEPLRGAEPKCGCVRSHHASAAARGRPGRPLPHFRSSGLISSSRGDSLSLPYFAFRNGCDGDDDDKNDDDVWRSEYQKQNTDDNDDKEGDDK